MEHIITKNKITVTLDKCLNDVLNEEISNKSKYVEWLIFQDMKKHSKNKKMITLFI